MTIFRAAGSKILWRFGDGLSVQLVSLVWQGFGYLRVYLQNTCFLGDRLGERRTHVQCIEPAPSNHPHLWSLARKESPAPPLPRRGAHCGYWAILDVWRGRRLTVWAAQSEPTFSSTHHGVAHRCILFVYMKVPEVVGRLDLA